MTKTFMRTFLMVVLATPAAVAGPYYDLKMDVSTATMKVSGAIKVAASSSSPNVPIFDLDGAAKLFTLKGSSIAFTDGGAVAGDLLVTSSVTANYIQGGGANFPLPVTGISLSEIEDLTANKTFTMANKTLEWQFTNPSGGMLWEFTGAAGGHSLDIMQSGGNPGADMHLLHLHAEDADPTALHLVPGSATSRAVLVHANGDTLTNPGRFEMNAAGAMAWGTGAGATDTTLARSGAGALLSNSTITAAGFAGPLTGAASANVRKTGDTMTGGLTLLTSSVTVHNATSGTAYGAFRFYDDSPNNPVVTIGMNSVGTKTELVTCAGGSNCGPGAGGYSWAADGNIMGFNTSGVLSAPSFSGPLTGLASLNLPLTGGTLTGPLTLAGSSLTVTGAGSVGVGAAAIYGRLGQKIEASVSATYGGLALNTWSATAAHAPLLDLNHSLSGTIGTQSLVPSGGGLGALTFSGSDGVAFRNAAAIQAHVDGTSGSGDMPGRLTFHTTPDGSTILAERMRIDNAGAVTIPGSSFSVGTSTFVVTGGKVGVGTASPGGKLSVETGSANDVSGFKSGDSQRVYIQRGEKSNYGSLSFITEIATAGDWHIGPQNEATGFFAIAVGASGYDSGTAPKMAILPSGSVGIGTTSPDQKLTVAGNISATGQVISSGTGSNYFLGNVGIGTSTPGTMPLVIKPTTTATGLRITESDSDAVALQLLSYASQGAMYIGSGGSTDVSLVGGGASYFKTGPLGVGTISPAAKLHVQDGVVLSSTTSGFGAFTGYGSSGGCLMFRDTDNAGWTECKFLDGTMSCATDADGVCD